MNQRFLLNFYPNLRRSHFHAGVSSPSPVQPPPPPHFLHPQPIPAKMLEEGTMPVDLAIRRELEHRKKLAQMQQIPEAEFCRNLRPFVVQPPIPGPSLSSRQRPSLNPAAPPLPEPQVPNQKLKASQPYSSSSSERRQLHHASSLHPCPSKSLEVIPLMQQKQGPNNQLESQPIGPENPQSHNDYTFCKTCLVPCSGYFNFKQHIEGRKHKNRQMELERGRNAGRVGESPRRWCETCMIWCMNEDLFQAHLGGSQHKNQVQKLRAGEDNDKQIVLVKQGFKCDVCCIECSGEYTLHDHLKGKKHRAELQKLNSGSTQIGQYRCDLCNIWCIDGPSLEMHMRGKKHIVKLHESQRKKPRF